MLEVARKLVGLVRKLVGPVRKLTKRTKDLINHFIVFKLLKIILSKHS